MSDIGEIPTRLGSFEILLPPRYGKWKVDNTSLPEFDKFINNVIKVIPRALEECHPLVRRANFEIEIVPEIVKDSGLRAGAEATFTRTKDNGVNVRITIPKSSLEHAVRIRPDTHWSITALGLLLHEVFEIDYELKSERLLNRAPRLPLGNKDYQSAEHEVIANQRTLAALRKFLGADYVIQDGCTFALALNVGRKI